MEINQPASGSMSNFYIDPDTLIAPLHAPRGVGDNGNRNTAGGEEKDGDGDNDAGDESDDGDVSGPPAHIAAGVSEALEEIEDELGVTNRLLRNNVDILYYNAEIEGFGESRATEFLSRINSPISDKYIDVHFSYHSRRRYNRRPVQWLYTIGFRISRHAIPRVQTPPSHTATLEMLRNRPITHRYGTQGWRSIVHAFHDDKCRPIEGFSFNMDMDDFVDAHDALWGPLDPLEELPPDASEEDEIEHRETLIRALRVLLGAIGIDYYIACSDDDDDFAPDQKGNNRGQLGWMIEGAGDRWLARGARQACGFQLKRDPAEERVGREKREGIARQRDSD